VDARLYAIARAALRVDACALRADTTGLADARRELLAVEAPLDPRRTPMLVALAGVERVRIEALVWTLTHDPSAERRAHQGLDRVRLLLGPGHSQRLSSRIEAAAARLERPPRRPVLDEPLAEPY